MTRRWSLRLVAGLAAGAALLGGCSGEQQAADTLPSAAAPTTSEAELPPLGPADLPMPDEARTQDAAGAEAFVRYYIDLINRTSTVMDAAPLREFSNGCEQCNRLASNTESDAAAGLDYDGGEIAVTEVAPPLVTDSRVEMAIRIDQAALLVRDRSGSAVEDLSSAAISALPGSATTEWDPSIQSWIMTALTFGS